MNEKYDDFYIKISSNARTGAVGTVLRSRAGGTSPCALNLSANDTRLSVRNLRLADYAEGPDARRAEMRLQELGRSLFRAVFVEPLPISTAYLESKALSEALRIRLHIDDPALAELPWECLYDDNAVPGYVNLTSPIVRHFELDGRVWPRPVVGGPLRILGVVANPTTGEWPPFNDIEEIALVERALDHLERSGLVTLHWSSDTTA